ncbi:MAG: VOC family protein [Erysipelotrichaceae bacterium]|nr:VOC family protein [Erysipelotrichaceae bacterium]
MKTHHAALRPAPQNFERTLQFYTELLGFKTSARWSRFMEGMETQCAMVHPEDGICLEIFGCGKTDEPGMGPWQHFCYQVDDGDALIKKLVKAGYQTTDPAGNPVEFVPGREIVVCEDPLMHWRCSFVKGPCGELIEFLQDLEK